MNERIDIDLLLSINNELFCLEIKPKKIVAFTLVRIIPFGIAPKV
jgi:hypothetical protein